MNHFKALSLTLWLTSLLAFTACDSDQSYSIDTTAVSVAGVAHSDCGADAITMTSSQSLCIPGSVWQELNTVPERPVLEVMFVIDTTASMIQAIRQIRYSLPEIVPALQELTDNQLRMGVATFRDFPDFSGFTNNNYPYRLDVPLTTDVSLVENRLSSLRAENGGDVPETLNFAIHQAVTGLGHSSPEFSLSPTQPGWSENAVKIIIPITDAPTKTNFGPGIEGVNQILDENGFHVIGLYHQEEGRLTVNDYATEWRGETPHFPHEEACTLADREMLGDIAEGSRLVFPYELSSPCLAAMLNETISQTYFEGFSLNLSGRGSSFVSVEQSTVLFEPPSSATIPCFEIEVRHDASRSAPLCLQAEIKTVREEILVLSQAYVIAP